MSLPNFCLYMYNIQVNENDSIDFPRCVSLADAFIRMIDQSQKLIQSFR